MYPKEEIQKGLEPVGQIPLSTKEKFKTLNELGDLGQSNYKAFKYYNKMLAFVDEVEKHYIWREVKPTDEAGSGLIVGNFQYPANTVTSEFDYSDKIFNFFLHNTVTEQDNLTPVIQLTETVIPTQEVPEGTNYNFNFLPIENLVESLDFVVKENENLYFTGQMAIYDFSKAQPFLAESFEPAVINIYDKKYPTRYKAKFIDCIWRFRKGKGNYDSSTNNFSPEDFLLVENSSLGTVPVAGENGVQLININYNNIENITGAFNSATRQITNKDIIVKVYTFNSISMQNGNNSGNNFTLWRFIGGEGTWGGVNGDTALQSHFILIEGIGSGQSNSTQNNKIVDLDLGSFNTDIPISQAMANQFTQTNKFNVDDDQIFFITMTNVMSTREAASQKSALSIKKYAFKPGTGSFYQFSESDFSEIERRSKNLNIEGADFTIIDKNVNSLNDFANQEAVMDFLNELLNDDGETIVIPEGIVYFNLKLNQSASALYQFTGAKQTYNSGNNFSDEQEFIKIEKDDAATTITNLSDLNNDVGFITEAIVPIGKFLIFKRNGNTILSGPNVIEEGDFVKGIVENVYIEGVYRKMGLPKTALSSFDIFERKEFN